MKNYPTIKSVLPFQTTILGSVVPVVEDQNYILGDSPLTINYDAFQVLPTGYDSGPSSV